MCWPPTPEHDVFPGMWLTYLATYHYFIEENDFFTYPSRYPSRLRASWLGMEFCFHSPISCYNCVRIELLYAVTVSVSSDTGEQPGVGSIISRKVDLAYIRKVAEWLEETR